MIDESAVLLEDFSSVDPGDRDALLTVLRLGKWNEFAGSQPNDWRPDFEGVSLEDECHENVRLRRAFFRGADLSGATFVGCDLSCADFEGAKLELARFDSCDLTSSSFKNADLSEVDFMKSDLTEASFLGANLQSAYLDQAKLTSVRDLLTVGPVDGWMGYAVRHEDRTMIKFGCRWYSSRSECARHWNGIGRPTHDRVMMLGVDALLDLARGLGWPVLD